jgi:hypothetical protein
MIHGPCTSVNLNSSCVKDGKCTKRYPRQLIHDTQTGDDDYPLYRRRSVEDGDIKAKITMKCVNAVRDIEIDNKWVVPYYHYFHASFKYILVQSTAVRSNTSASTSIGVSIKLCSAWKKTEERWMKSDVTN